MRSNMGPPMDAIRETTAAVLPAEDSPSIGAGARHHHPVTSSGVAEDTLSRARRALGEDHPDTWGRRTTSPIG